MQKYLTDLEIAKIEAFCKDKEMYNAVRKVLLKGIYTEGTVQLGHIPDPQTNGAFALAGLAIQNPIPDEQLGQHIRSMWAGVNYLKNAFDSLESVHSEQEGVLSEYNEAI